jgi:curved DNA-binding protein CbpA
MKNHYDTLSVARDAPVEVIRAAYRVLSQKWHPDKGGSAEKMASINEAWHILSDPDRREAHDIELSFIRLRPDPKPDPKPAQPAYRRGAPLEIDPEQLRKAWHPRPNKSQAMGSPQFGGLAAGIFRLFGG